MKCDVNVTRTASATRTYTVEAKTYEAVVEAAIEAACNDDWRGYEKSAEYEVGTVLLS